MLPDSLFKFSFDVFLEARLDCAKLSLCEHSIELRALRSGHEVVVELVLRGLLCLHGLHHM